MNPEAGETPKSKTRKGSQTGAGMAAALGIKAALGQFCLSRNFETPFSLHFPAKPSQANSFPKLQSRHRGKSSWCALW